MLFEWDESKRRANLAEHGIDFEAAKRIFDGPVVEQIDDREGYGELRLGAFGQVDGVVLAVVYTWRGENRRLISARRAEKREQQKYYAQAGVAGSEG
jgi:hypothetical protein